MRFIVNPRLEEELQRSAEMVRMLKDRAEKAAMRVRQIAPRGDSPAGEHYADMIAVEIVAEKGIPTPRVVARKSTSVYVEFGTIDTPTFAPLRRATQSIGLHLRRR